MTRLLDRSRWIAQLPDAVEEAPVDLVLVGWVAYASDLVRIVSGELCLTFASNDVLDVEELGEDRIAGSSAVRESRVVVRRGSPLLDVCPRECIAGLMPVARRPFAISSRPHNPQAAPATRYPELEAVFLAEAGLALEDSP